MTAKKRMRVLHVIKTLSLGGAEANLYNLVKASDRDRFEVHVAYSYGGEFEPALRELGVRLCKFAERSHRVRSLASAGIILRLAWYLLRHRIRVVHTHNYNAHVWGAIAAKLVFARVVEHVHDSRYEDAEYLRTHGILRPEQFQQARYFARLSDRIVVLTQRNERYLTGRLAIPARKVVRQGNGIPLDRATALKRQALRAELGIRPEQHVVFAAGRLSPEKNMSSIVMMAAMVKRTDPDTVFLVAGSGPEQAVIEERIRRLRVADTVRLLGFRSNILELLEAVDIFIQPSLLELQSVTMLEAMSLGIPVIVSKGVGCNDEFLAHGRTGFLLDPTQPQLWAETISRLVRDAALAVDVGREGRRLVESRCDIRQTMQQFERWYTELAG
jgi:glycosyltransferase involved in cell wall biosynthesis